MRFSDAVNLDDQSMTDEPMRQLHFGEFVSRRDPDERISTDAVCQGVVLAQHAHGMTSGIIIAPGDVGAAVIRPKPAFLFAARFGGQRARRRA